MNFKLPRNNSINVDIQTCFAVSSEVSKMDNNGWKDNLRLKVNCWLCWLASFSRNNRRRRDKRNFLSIGITLEMMLNKGTTELVDDSLWVGISEESWSRNVTKWSQSTSKQPNLVKH